MVLGGSNPPHPTTYEPTPDAIGFAFWLKTKRRLADSTIEFEVKKLVRLTRSVNRARY